MSCILPFYIWFSSLVINACWCIHFGFHIIFLCLVSVTLFKGYKVLVHKCSLIIQIQGGSACIFDYFVLSPNWFCNRYTTRNCKIPSGYIVILKRVLSTQSANADLHRIVPHNTSEGFQWYLFGFINTVLDKFPDKLTFSKSCFWCICTAIGWKKLLKIIFYALT